MSGLELARQPDMPVSNSMAKKEQDDDKYLYDVPDGLQGSYDEKPTSPPKARCLCCRPCSTIFILSVALASVTLLAIVAAAVGGALAAKKEHEYIIPSLMPARKKETVQRS